MKFPNPIGGIGAWAVVVAVVFGAFVALNYAGVTTSTAAASIKSRVGG